MTEHQETRADTLATIERRFQFVIILALFLPFAWDSLVKVSTNITGTWATGPISYIGNVISYVFLSYFVFELFRKLINKILLNFIAEALLVLTYTLIVMIGFGITNPTITLSGWRLVILSVALLGNLFIPPIILISVAVASVIVGIRWVTKRVQK